MGSISIHIRILRFILALYSILGLYWDNGKLKWKLLYCGIQGLGVWGLGV